MDQGDQQHVIEIDQPPRGALESFGRKPEKVVAPVISLTLHAIFLIIAAWIMITPPAGPGTREVTIDFATLEDESLVDLNEHSNNNDEEPLVDELLESSAVIETLAVVDPATSSSAATDPGSLDALGGAGEAVNPGQMLGGGGGTSFFGIASQGRRFVYLVDVSGSMSNANRIGELRVNLNESIAQLPEQAEFVVIAYSDASIPFGEAFRWWRADRATKFRVKAWVNRLEAQGGTYPQPGFEEAFKLRPRPDVIYFMTDGQDIQDLPAYIASKNTKGRKTRINTIAFGDRGSEEMMRRIAQESGGVYRYVPDGGGP